MTNNQGILFPVKKNGKSGYIDGKRRTIIDFEFNFFGSRSLSEGLCAVWDNGFGYINHNGELLIPYQFALGAHFSEGMAVIKPKGRNKKYGFIDKEGKVKVKPVFTHVEDFQNGLSEVIIGDEYDRFQYGYIDKQGEYIWKPTR